MKTSTRFKMHLESLVVPVRGESLSIPMHLQRYADEVELWRLQALAARAARAEGRGR